MENIATIMKEVDKKSDLIRFVRGSNQIEGIERDPTKAEIKEMERFLGIGCVTIDEIEKFLSVYEPTAKLRSKRGMNVSVGEYIPPDGDEGMGYKLLEIIEDIKMSKESAFEIHNRYESLHPFTDGNGRSGRAIWLWQMVRVYGYVPKLTFLQTYYYHSLSFCRKQLCSISRGS